MKVFRIEDKDLIGNQVPKNYETSAGPYILEDFMAENALSLVTLACHGVLCM